MIPPSSAGPLSPSPRRGSTWVCGDARSAPSADAARALAREGVSAADVTLYGPSAEIHGFHARDRAAFAEVLRGARALVDAGVRVGLTVPVTRANVRHLSEMVDVASALGAEAIRFEPADADRAPSAAITADHLDAAVRHAARLRIRAVTRLPSATDEIFGHAALGGRPNRSDGSRREAQPNLLSAASAPSTLPSHSAR